MNQHKTICFQTTEKVEKEIVINKLDQQQNQLNSAKPVTLLLELRIKFWLILSEELLGIACVSQVDMNHSLFQDIVTL